MDFDQSTQLVNAVHRLADEQERLAHAQERVAEAMETQIILACLGMGAFGDQNDIRFKAVAGRTFQGVADVARRLHMEQEHRRSFASADPSTFEVKQ